MLGGIDSGDTFPGITAFFRVLRPRDRVTISAFILVHLDREDVSSV